LLPVVVDALRVEIEELLQVGDGVGLLKIVPFLSGMETKPAALLQYNREA
jgi:hypothetical protein